MSAALPALTVVLGAPHSGLDSWGAELAAAQGAVVLAGLRLTAATHIGDLLQMQAVAQEPIHEPLWQAVAVWIAEAQGDAASFLDACADALVAGLFEHLRRAIGRPLVVVDTDCGFRIGDTEAWGRLAPDAEFVHAVTPPGDFARASQRFYQRRLYVPPDYRDHCIGLPAPRLEPRLAWYQVQATIARALGEHPHWRARRVVLPAAALPGPAQRLEWPFVASDRAMMPSLDQLAAFLGVSPD